MMPNLQHALEGLDSSNRGETSLDDLFQLFQDSMFAYNKGRQTTSREQSFNSRHQWTEVKR